MPKGIATALTVVRVKRGQPPPSETEFRAAIERDRARLHLPAEHYQRDLGIAGPYAISVGEQELDEYVVWER